MGTNTIKSDTQCVLDSLRKLVQELRVSSAKNVRTMGLTGAQLFILKQLQGSKMLSLNEIAARTFTHQSTVSGVVERLLSKKLVSCKRSKKDGRQLEIEITKTGKGILKKAPRSAQEKIALSLQSMKPRARHELALLFDEVILKSGFSAKPYMFFEKEK